MGASGALRDRRGRDRLGPVRAGPTGGPRARHAVVLVDVAARRARSRRALHRPRLRPARLRRLGQGPRAGRVAGGARATAGGPARPLVPRAPCRRRSRHRRRRGAARAPGAPPPGGLARPRRRRGFPKIVTTGVSAATSSRRFGSSPGLLERWRVLPNAASFACSQRVVRAAAKNSMSLGLEPGQPPSMNGKPYSSSIRATRSLSASESVMFSPCVPSRRVVS